ncbi:hypothetical protein [Stenotrophomonas sp. ZAC14D2_NAIMI4_7]|uniref:hypothetical protein n=1 Tax=Stenotrophomonas sp. ZAC14D2_NAIMI4_7 TaxID=2072405 RepID=UPI001F354848|nr:hypothetical protein [Stenotrophomonas sp. ZAC14D2_NAIMI4_7]
MATPDVSPLRPARPAAADPTTFAATLRRIGRGAAANGQPWPEHHPMPTRRVQLADADCAEAGLRVVQGLLLAAERLRQSGNDEQCLGDRVMEELMMACGALSAQVCDRLHGDGAGARA